jgi:rod shape determining protein RodA
MLRAQVWRRLDYMLLLAVAGLTVYGLMMVHSATCSPSCERILPPSSWATRQGLYVVAGLLAMIAASSINYRIYRALAYYAYGLSLMLLAAVLVVGHGDVDYGARRWISLGAFDFQPSEVAKLALVIALARFLSDRQGGLGLRRAVISIVFVVPPIILVHLQPNLGTVLAFVVIWFGMVAMAGAKLIHLGLLMLASALAAPAGWVMLREYQRARIETFFMTLMNPEADPFGEGYNILQARISIGSGGMFGRGWLQGTQTQLDYLRVKQSDFIFSVLAEEMGFIGAVVLFLLFALLLFRIIRAADRARDDFGRLAAFGIACTLLFQVVVNLGANLTLMPVTGVPLPLVSFGGSAMITFFAAFGIVQSILIRRTRYRY